MANFLIDVQTWQMAGLAFLLNEFAFIANSNKKFMNFQNYAGQLGQTVTFEKPPRLTTRNSLVVAFEDAEQRTQSLTVDKQVSTAIQFTSQQLVFNDIEDYMERFGKASATEIGTQVESDVATLAVSAPYRFFGDGVTQINSYFQLAQAIANFKSFGSAVDNVEGYLADLMIPGVINNGLSQFVMRRNEEDARKWMLGEFAGCEWFRSNLLPLHTAGSEGQANQLLTVVAVVKNADDAVTSITFGGTSAANDANSVRQFDKFQFQDGVAGQPNLRFLTWIGHKPTGLPVQFKATANAASTAGSQVTVTVDPPLKASAGKNQNINNEIAVGMQVRALPNHRAGLIMSGKPMFLAMPQLPDQDPFPTGNAYDEESGVSMRVYKGAVFGQNQNAIVHDAIYGYTAVPENCMSVIFPE